MKPEERTKERYDQTRTRKAASVSHLFTSILTQVAVAVLEAIVLRLLTQLWKTYATGGRPAAAGA
jgi:hypothetical protein